MRQSPIHDLDRWLAWHLPGDLLKNIYPRGMRRLAEHGVWSGSHEVTTRHGARMLVNRVDAIKWCIYYYGQFEPRITRAFVNGLEPGDTVIDIGANIGYHSLLAAKLVADTGKVVAFEPSRRNFAELVANVDRNGLASIVECHRLAVSDQVGELPFYYAGDNEQGSSSLLETRNAGSSEMVSVITFDQIATLCDLEEVALIKIDVEGAEKQVVRGMVPHLSKLPGRCLIFLEISPDEAGDAGSLLQMFYDQGFDARVIPNEYDPRFFRSDYQVELRPVELERGRIVDLVLCRDPRMFARIDR